MAGSWGTVLTGLVPLGLVISLSPLTVIPAVLVLQARGRGRAAWRSWAVGCSASPR